MATRRKADAKDSATKNTLNSPGRGRGRQDTGPKQDQKTDNREIGQFSDRGNPANIKK